MTPTIPFTYRGLIKLYYDNAVDNLGYNTVQIRRQPDVSKKYDIQYPLCCIEIPEYYCQSDGGMIIKMAFWSLDRPFVNYNITDNESIVSEAHLVALSNTDHLGRSLIQKLLKEADQYINAETFRFDAMATIDDFEDRLTGWRFETEHILPFHLSYCYLPYEEYLPIAYDGTCNEATIQPEE